MGAQYGGSTFPSANDTIRAGFILFRLFFWREKDAVLDYPVFFSASELQLIFLSAATLIYCCPPMQQPAGADCDAPRIFFYRTDILFEFLFATHRSLYTNVCCDADFFQP
jgi:hypothetical protein